MGQLGSGLAAFLVVVTVGACGGDSWDDSAGTIAVGGGPLVVSDQSLQLRIETVRSLGDSVSTGEGTLTVDAAKMDTHTIFGLPFEASVVEGEQWGFEFESLELRSGDAEVEAVLICRGSSCGGSTSSFGVYEGDRSEFVLYAVGESSIESLSVEFAGAVTWPPTGLDTTPGIPDVPAEPADTVTEEVTP